MATSVIFEEQVEIPLTIRSLADFRRWVQSEGFPQTGRIDYLSGKIEVDMSPENLFCHGTLKTELIRAIATRVKLGIMGHLFTDSTRVSCPKADLSVEPDVVFVSHEALDSGRVRLIPSASQEPGSYIELEGPPDVIVEIVSDSSVGKDTRRLPEAYYKAGVREFWLADARKDPAVLGCSFRLDSRRDARGNWAFDLRDKP